MNTLPDFRLVLLKNAAAAGVAEDDFRPLDGTEAVAVAEAVKERFGDASNGAMAGWWRSDRPCAVPTLTRRFESDEGWSYLTVLAPAPTESVWLIAENWSGQKPPYLIFAGTAAGVQRVLGETHSFEYMVAGRSLTWLFAEDHESCIAVAGEEAVRRLRAISASSSSVGGA